MNLSLVWDEIINKWKAGAFFKTCSCNNGRRFFKSWHTWRKLCQDGALWAYVYIYIMSDLEDRARWLLHRKRQRIFNSSLPVSTTLSCMQFHPLVISLHLHPLTFTIYTKSAAKLSPSLWAAFRFPKCILITFHFSFFHWYVNGGSCNSCYCGNTSSSTTVIINSVPMQ